MANIVKGKSVSEAIAHLSYSGKRAGDPLIKLLKSAVANAKARDIDTSALSVKDIRVDAGVTLKRMRPRSRGMGSPINKRTSHVTVLLEQKNQIPSTKSQKSSKSKK